MRVFYISRYVFLMLQMDLFIRHNCGERKNTFGHRWLEPNKKNFDNLILCWTNLGAPTLT